MVKVMKTRNGVQVQLCDKASQEKETGVSHRPNKHRGRLQLLRQEMLP